jgi:hypothetical protein
LTARLTRAAQKNNPRPLFWLKDFGRRPKKMNKLKVLSSSIILILLLSLIIVPPLNVFARQQTLGISPILGELLGYSVLAGDALTNTGFTITDGAVGVSPGTSITGFPDGVAGGSGLHSNDASAIAAQAEALIVFDALDQFCDTDWSGTGLVDLGGESLVPGVYCADSFGLTGTLTLTGGAGDVYIFKSASTLITSSASSVVGGDPCHIWWRVTSSTTLGSGSSFRGTVLSQTGVTSMTTDANLVGRFLALSSAELTLDDNTITAPVCLVAPTEEDTDRPTVSGLPNTGGAPIQNQAFPWGLLIAVGISVGALALGVQTYRRTHSPKQ